MGPALLLIGDLLLVFLLILIPSLLIYVCIFFFLRTLLRRLPDRRSRRAVAAAIFVSILLPYGAAVEPYIRTLQWEKSETVTRPPIPLTPDDSIVIQGSYCYHLCLELLTQSQVGSVITREGKSKGSRTRWTLVRDPSVCDPEKASSELWRGKYGHLLAQGYCVRGEATDEPATYIFRVTWKPSAEKIWPIRFVRSVADRDGNVLAQEANWQLKVKFSPPILVHMGVPTRFELKNFEWFEITLGKEEEWDSPFLARAFGLDLTRRHSYAPILIDDPQTAAANAARSPSIKMQKSALALICAMGRERRGEFGEAIDVLRASSDRQVRETAERIARWPQGSATLWRSSPANPCGGF